MEAFAIAAGPKKMRIHESEFKMIDLHTHTLLSDGELLPAELVRRAEENGYTAIAITDHADISNMDFLIPRTVKACRIFNKHWEIKAIPGVEFTHMPVEEIKEYVKAARKLGAQIIVGHGESPVEPVIKGTNRAYILAGVDIVSHPGYISEKDARLASERGVYLEITTRRGHCLGNKHVIKAGFKYGVNLVLNTDSHKPEDLINDQYRDKFLKSYGLGKSKIDEIIANSERLVKKRAGT